MDRGPRGCGARIAAFHERAPRKPEAGSFRTLAQWMESRLGRASLLRAKPCSVLVRCASAIAECVMGAHSTPHAIGDLLAARTILSSRCRAVTPSRPSCPSRLSQRAGRTGSLAEFARSVGSEASPSSAGNASRPASLCVLRVRNLEAGASTSCARAQCNPQDGGPLRTGLRPARPRLRVPWLGSPMVPTA